MTQSALAAFVQQVQLVDVRLTQQAFQLHGPADLTAALHVNRTERSIDWQALGAPSDGTFEVRATMAVKGTARDGDPLAGPLFEARASVAARYVCGDRLPPRAVLDDFARTSGLAHTTAYLRTYLQDLLAKAGIGAVVLPLEPVVVRAQAEAPSLAAVETLRFAGTAARRFPPQFQCSAAIAGLLVRRDEIVLLMQNMVNAWADREARRTAGDPRENVAVFVWHRHVVCAVCDAYALLSPHKQDGNGPGLLADKQLAAVLARNPNSQAAVDRHMKALVGAMDLLRPLRNAAAAHTDLRPIRQALEQEGDAIEGNLWIAKNNADTQFDLAHSLVLNAWDHQRHGGKRKDASADSEARFREIFHASRIGSQAVLEIVPSLLMAYGHLAWGSGSPAEPRAAAGADARP